MRKLFVLSKPVDNRPRLIGELTEENGEYQFKYRLGGTFPEWYLQLREFPYADKEYSGDDVYRFVKRLIPARNDNYIRSWLRDAKLRKYDEWGLLKFYGKRNVIQADAFIYEDIPQEAVIYG